MLNYLSIGLGITLVRLPRAANLPSRSMSDPKDTLRSTQKVSDKSSPELQCTVLSQILHRRLSLKRSKASVEGQSQMSARVASKEPHGVNLHTSIYRV